MVANGEYQTIDTPLAAYLVHLGFNLIEIRYIESERYNQKRQGIYIFQKTPEISSPISDYNQGKAQINLAQYERIRNSLMDRIMRGLP